MYQLQPHVLDHGDGYMVCPQVARSLGLTPELVKHRLPWLSQVSVVHYLRRHSRD